jgi:hypothetical protein
MSSSITQDDYVFKKSNETIVESTIEGKKHQTHIHNKPFLDKQLNSIKDENNGSDYSRNESKFSTLSVASSSKLPDYSQSYILIPVVVRLHRQPASNSVDDQACGIADARNQIQFKSCTTTLIDRMEINYGNSNVTQGVKNLNGYQTYLHHVENSLDDVNLSNSYYKPTNKWEYDSKEGMKFDTAGNNYVVEFEKVNENSVLSLGNIVTSGMNYYHAVSDKEHFYYYYAFISLKEYNFFDALPLSKGSNLEITINFNQSVTTTEYTLGDKTSIINQLSGSTNALLRINEVAKAGSFTETVSLSIGQAYGSNGQPYFHPLKQCRLYIPEYTLSPEVFSQYIGTNSIKKIVYEDIIVKHLTNLSSGSSIDAMLSSNISNIQKLIIIPMLSKESNITENLFTKYSPQESMFSQEPTVCSPYLISNFQVKVGNQNIYLNNMPYKHDQFMLELNGAQGVEGGLQTGFSSGQINISDYLKNYGYLVCDLSRKGLEDVDKLFQISISGKIESPKSLDLLCYLVVQKQVVIDISTGTIVQQ